MGTRIRILLADAHQMVRQGLKLILQAREDLEVIGETGNGKEAVEMTCSLGPDVVVMDVTLPEMNGIEATRQIRERAPSVRILALSVHGGGVYVREMVRAGAEGYVLKESADTDLIAAVRAVAAGNSYLSPDVASVVLKDYRTQAKNPVDVLTAREQEILRLLAEGKTNKGIATLLDLSIYTVDRHRARIMTKLGLHSIGDLVRFAIRNGVVD